jgi:hypothetical protein
VRVRRAASAANAETTAPISARASTSVSGNDPVFDFEPAATSEFPA